VLSRRMIGRRIDRCELASFAALRTVAPALGDLVGRTVVEVRRRGKFVCVGCGHLWLVLHLARGGWVRWYDEVPAGTARPSRSPLALRVGLDDGSGFDVTEMGTEKRLALWVVGSPEEVGPLAALGFDPLGPDFTTDRLSALLADTSATLKTVLTTQSLIAGVGNAYSDEALHRAGLSPYKRADKLEPAEETELLEGAGGTGVGGMSAPMGIPHASRTDVQDVVPVGETEVGRGEHVHALDGEIGQVQGFLVDPGDHRVTHVLLQEGHLWGRKEVAIPMSAVTGIENGIRLSMTKKQIEDLPSAH